MAQVSGETGFQGIQSVSRALSILELFSDKRPSLSVSQVAEITGLNRATCYRFCQTLRKLGYLEELGDRRFRPGLKAVSLAHSALSSRELPELAHAVPAQAPRGDQRDRQHGPARRHGGRLRGAGPERPPDLASALRRQPPPRLRILARAGDPRLPPRGAGRGDHRPQRAEAAHDAHDRGPQAPARRARRSFASAATRSTTRRSPTGCAASPRPC